MTWGFDGAHGTDVRPAHKESVSDWAKDPSTPTANDGTRLGASLINRLIGNIRAAATRWSVPLTEDSDDDVGDIVAAAIAATAPATHNHDDRYYTESEVDDAIALKAPLASPTFTGTPAAPTAAGGTNTTQLATTAFVQAAVAALINSAPGVLDTLDEIAAALGDDANFAATMTSALALKAPLASPTFTGTPSAPTAAGGTNTTQLATTAFVTAAIAAISAGVVSFNSRTGAVTPANDDYAVGNLSAIADATLVGNNTGGAARPLALTAANVLTLLALATALKSDATATLTKGYTATAYDAGTKSTGTFTPAPADGNMQRYVNGGAHTLAAPTAAGDYTIVIQITNNASAGAITLSGFSKITGDTLTTTNGDDFLLFIAKVNGFTHCHKQVLQ